MSLTISKIDSNTLSSVVEHVFIPPRLPQEAPTEAAEQETNKALCHLLIEAARAFHEYLPDPQQSTWTHMIKMMKFVLRNVQARLDEMDLQSALSDLAVEGEFLYLCVMSV
jgi:hypothetical protein